jgi:hypothetical protein
MTTQERIRQSLILFPKLYYFIPCINPHERQAGGTTLLFDEPMDAILWFIDLVITDSKRNDCPRPILKNLIRRWYGEKVDSDFERCYSDLLENRFIIAQQWSEDRRIHLVQLTDKGRLLLQQIKDKRYQDIELLRREVQNLPRKDKKIVIRLFDRMSKLAWRKMLEDEDPDNIYQLYEKSNTLISSPSKKRIGKKSKKTASKL